MRNFHLLTYFCCLMKLTGNNLSSTYSLKAINEKPLIVRVVVGILLYVNGLMIFTFLKKETFRDTRYFCSDSFCRHVLSIPCANKSLLYDLHTMMSFLTFCTTMCLESYVAICLP